MENQGKRKSQMKDSETFVIISIYIILIVLLIISVSSCTANAQQETIPDERIFIHMSDGDSLELVADEYGNQYLKEYIQWPHHVYIPYQGETEEQDTLQFYNVKNK